MCGRSPGALCSAAHAPQLGHLFLHGWILFPVKLRGRVRPGSVALSLMVKHVICEEPFPAGMSVVGL